MRNPGNMLRAAVLVLGITAVISSAVAFDYRDGSAVRDRGGDLASLYAFVPNVGGEVGPLTVALTIKPYALSVAEVGKDTEYSIRIRAAGLAGSGERLRTKLGAAELAITCNYFDHDYQIGCIASHISADGSTRVLGAVSGDLGDVMTAPGMRAMSALRSDPLLINFHATLNCLEDDEVEFLGLDDAFKRRVHPKFRNSIEHKKMNVVGLVIEVNRSWLPQEAGLPLIAVAAQSVDVANDGTRTPLDRIGRTGTSTFLIQDDEARNGWNATDPYDAAGATAFRAEMQRGLTAVDSHSRRAYWAWPHPLLELLLSDHLLLNPNVPVAAIDASRNNYFELEWAAYTGRSLNGLAGGRRPIDNSISRFFAVMARQAGRHFAQLEALKHPLYRQTHAAFPYLAAPYEKPDTLFSRTIEELNPRSPTIRGCVN